MIEIKDYIPHRYPFLFIDKILFYKKYKNILILKNVTCSEKYFQGHFIEKNIVPGILIIETMAQTSGLLANISLEKKNKKPNFYLINIENAKFKKIIIPGDQIYIESKILNIKNKIWRFQCQSFVDGKLTCKSKISCIENYDICR